MKYLLLSLMLPVCLVLNAQDTFKAVDRKEVEMLVTDNSAATHYPKLLSRFLADDSTLTIDDFRLLYYGFVFQKDYSGYPALKQKEVGEAIKNKNYETGLKLCDAILAKYPINLFGNYNKGLLLFLMNKEDTNVVKYRNRYHNITTAIVSSGNGLSCETAFKTIFVNDEYQIINTYFGVEQIKGQSLQLPCDKMSISPSKQFTAAAMYFDTSETFLAMQKLFDKK